MLRNYIQVSLRQALREMLVRRVAAGLGEAVFV